MTGAGTEIVRLVIEAARNDPSLAADLAVLLRPYLRDERPVADGWLCTRAAAEYAGTTVTALHKATAARAVRFEQERPGGKCWFKRSWIDAWREGS